jgi:hypothetical protein
MAIVHKVGNPVNQCERRVISDLADGLPDSWHVYHNLELINRRGHPYEYDLIVFKDTLIWVIEVKNYRGTIKGNALTWELANGKFVRNPIPLTNEKARVLKSKVEDVVPWLRNDRTQLYIDTLIVICDNRTKIKFVDEQSTKVVLLSQLVERILEVDTQAQPSKYGQIAAGAISNMLNNWFGPISQSLRIGEYIVEDSASSRSDYSVTYPAHHNLLKTPAALKVFYLDPYSKKETLEKQRALALQSAKALTMIGEHPNIVHCDKPFTWESDKIVIPLEWVEGLTLRDLLNNHPDWPFTQRLDIFRQICNGLAYAHDKGVYHRALAPENIVIIDQDRVKLVGFDFAKIVSRELFTRLSLDTKYLRQGEQRYSAPEVLCDPHLASRKSDIFSAGVVLLELMIGYLPNVPQVQLATLHPSSISPLCPPDLDEICGRMCAPAPEHRYTSFEQILFDIEIIS